MPTNKQAMFSGAANTGWLASVLTSANTATDGTGTVVNVFTAGAEGSFIPFIRIKPLGTNVATVLRIFINNGSTNGTAANNTLWDEITLPATTGSNTAALPTYDVPMNIALEPGYTIFCTIGTAVASGFAVTVPGGDY